MISLSGVRPTIFRYSYALYNNGFELVNYNRKNLTEQPLPPHMPSPDSFHDYAVSFLDIAFLSL